MANARMISRDFFTSADLVDLPAPARLLFAGMIVYADDAGIVRDNVTFFQRTLLCGIDVRPCRVRSWTDALAMRHCIESVFLEGVKCWRITNFFRFQRLKRREGKRREVEVQEKAVVCAQEADSISTRMLQVEGLYDPPTARLLKAIREFAGVLEPKAREIYLRLREPKAATFQAWSRWGECKALVDRRTCIQNYDHPDAVPAEVESVRPKAKSEQDRIREYFASQEAH